MTQPGGIPPGWYATEHGWRWWDGTAWGPLAPPPAVALPDEQTGRGLSVLSHFGFLVGGFILPLVIYLTEGKRNRFTADHSREALNFQIFFMILWIGAGLLFFVTVFATAADNGPRSGPPAAVGFGFLVMGGLWLIGLVQSVFGAVRAGQGRRYRYPLTIRFVRG